jgi:predicted DNA-binding protein (MmcQ/YjbR family)
MGDEIVKALRAFGLAFPGAHSKSPWPGHDDLAVKDKTFAYLPADGEPFSLSVKLPYTSEVALDLPYAKPTAYGLGKSGWVTFTPKEEEMPPLDQLKEWIDESYRAQAPRRLVKEHDARAV